MTYIKVNSTLYPATIDGSLQDYTWDGRSTKKITMEGTYTEIMNLLPNNVNWSIVSQNTVPIIDESGALVINDDGTTQMTEKTEEWDNSEYSLSGPITDNRDGTCTIEMGKPTALEEAYEALIGG